jgi:N-acetylneuraminate synthase
MVLIGKFELKNYGEPYIIAEIGANHNGSIDLAKKMIVLAKEKGANCVKFQSWTKDSIFSKVVYDQNYFLNDDYRSRKDYNLEQIVDEYSLGEQQLEELNDYCKQIGMDFASTPFSMSEVDFLVNKLDIKFIKIASMDIDNLPFLEYVAKQNKPILLSTGLSTLSEIDDAIRTINNAGNNQLVLLHCVSQYPPEDINVNLKNIEMFQKLYDIPVGYSDHTIGYTAPILAIGKGACIIEKHFTIDNDMEGWDHKISANPEILEIITKECRRAKNMTGTYQIKQVESIKRRNAFRRSIVATRNINIGETITREDLDFKRPGTGLSPKNINFIIGKTAKKKILYDQILNLNDF